ncbi:MAG: 50S ribosome-binding GTPase [Chloroflexi bacterium]|nr:50S ribosome-binding GTPase [Chloroflexota bacterium]
MGNQHWLDKVLEKFQPELDNTKFNKFSDFLRSEYEKEIAIIPTIAIIGASGVGKTSTLNSLFGTNLRVSHTTAGTKQPSKIEIMEKGKRVTGTKGDLILYDMPGVDEDIDIDDEYIEIYRQIISHCDVAVWIVSATDRRMKHDQVFIRDVVTAANSDLASRLVIGVNKVDTIFPQNWDCQLNIPSLEQKRNLDEILENVRIKLTKVIPGLTRNRVVAYSARQRYHLQELFGGMLKACHPNRAWLLHSRGDVADYLELVAPEIRYQYMKG